MPPHIPKQLVVEYEHFTDALDVAPPLRALPFGGGGGPKMIELNEFARSKSSEFEDDESGDVLKKVLGSLGRFDENSQPHDLRKDNSWTAMLGQVHPVEVMETIMVNQFVPFLFINELIPLMSNQAAMRRSEHEPAGPSPKRRRMNNQRQTELIWAEIARRQRRGVERSYIVNVSAMEGRFHFFKQGTHPHTNMAKAALNMLTRTSALKLAQQHNVFMVAVDTGWVTDELPLKRRVRSKLRERKTMGGFDTTTSTDTTSAAAADDKETDEKAESETEKGAAADFKNDFVFHPPLDEIDGAARCLHPIWAGMRGKPYCGVFLKDYRRIDW